MKSIAIILFTALSFGGLAQAEDNQTGREWLRPPAKSNTSDKWVSIPKTDVYEVVASKEIVALVRDLPDKPFAPLSEDTAKYFTGHYYQTKAPKKPFLVRAVYGVGGTGGYTVSRRGNDLLISHGSLGSHSTCHKSALIVNLDFTPQQVYVVSSMAE